MAAGRLGGWFRSSSAWLVVALTIIIPTRRVRVYGCGVSEASEWTKRCTHSLSHPGLYRPLVREAALHILDAKCTSAFLVPLCCYGGCSTNLWGFEGFSFEVPWFGVGEDVENVGVVESVVRPPPGALPVSSGYALPFACLAFFGIRANSQAATTGKNRKHKSEKFDTKPASTSRQLSPKRASSTPRYQEYS